MPGLIVPRQPTANGGVAVTFQADAPDQGVYWELVSVDMETGQEGPARGSLKWGRTRTNGAGQSVNFYFAPSIENPQTSFDRLRVKVAA